MSESAATDSPTGKEGSGASSNVGDDASNGEDTSECRRRLSRLTRGSIPSSIFILLTTIVGAGSLSLPYALARGGVLVFIIILFILLWATVYVGIMLVHSKYYCHDLYPGLEVWSYEDLAYASFGVIGRIVSLFTLAILLFLALIAYMIYTRDQLTAVIYFIVERGHLPECTLLLNCGLLLMIPFFPIFPIILLRKLTPLQFTSYLGISSITLVAIFVVTRTILVNAKVIKYPLPAADRHVHLGPIETYDIIVVFSYCSLAYIGQFNLLPLQKELHNSSKKKMYIIIGGCVLVSYVFYNVIPFGAYFEFYDTLHSDVMLNYAVDDVMMTVARVCLFFTLTFHYPVLFHPARANINGAVYLIYTLISKKLCKRKRDDQLEREEERMSFLSSGQKIDLEFRVPTLPWFLETSAIYAVTFLSATFIRDVGLVWSFVGSTSGVLVFYVYPAAFFLRLRYVLHKRKALSSNTTIRSQYKLLDVLLEGTAWIMLVAGVILFVLQNYVAVRAVVVRPPPTNFTPPYCFIKCPYNSSDYGSVDLVLRD